MNGYLSHIDISVAESDRSIRFYDTLLRGLGYQRYTPNHAEFQGNSPSRAAWFIEYPDGRHFGIEVRPARTERVYDRYEPGPHHMAFHADSRAQVDRVAAAMSAIGATTLDAPADYGGQPGYSEGYYAAFFADPDNVKLEVVHLP